MPDMDKPITAALSGAMKKLRRHVKLVTLPNTDEATFRALFMAAAAEQLPDAVFQTEWRRVDLLLQRRKRNALIEFKYYIGRRTYNLDGTPGGRKGGPGPKNEDEFWACVQQLHECTFTPIHYKYLIVVYRRGPIGNSRYSYERSYGAITRGAAIRRVIRVPHCMDNNLACTVLRIR